MSESNVVHEDVKANRQAAHEIDATFLNRWSPYAFSSEPVDEEALMSALEAARWAASSYNEQPWRFLIARSPEDHQKFVDFLLPQNQAWAKNAPVLLVVVTKKTFSHNGQPNGCHQYDAGTASGYLTFQLTRNGLHSHGMAGFDKEMARASLGIPSDFEPMAVYAIGHHGDKSQLPEAMQQRDSPSSRRPLSESVMEGHFIEPKEEKAEADTITPDVK